MNELAELIKTWLSAEDINWFVVNYEDITDLLLYGKKPNKFVAIICNDRIILNDYIWPYKLISGSKQTIYATDPEFFEKLRFTMKAVEEAVNGHS